jgi:hypothetical protein
MLVLARSAEFDQTGEYRYCLGRSWEPLRPSLTWIMLNPSRADHCQEDPTLRRCLGLTQAWGYGALTVVNLFAYCSHQPQALKQVADPIGPENDRYLLAACTAAAAIALAWGNGGTLYGRDRAVLKLLQPYRDRCYCLGRNQTGQPRHPLYVKRQTRLLPWGVKPKQE